ncbi:hypothetical protein HYS00_00390 [Candidatus Microgenomates bacterium]|nr:hypothetical protein [Candidatus Microgenomates bacterium]
MANREQNLRQPERQTSSSPQKVLRRAIQELTATPTQLVVKDPQSLELILVDAGNADDSFNPVVRITTIESATHEAGDLTVFSVRPKLIQHEAANDAYRYRADFVGGVIFPTDDKKDAALVFNESNHPKGKSLSSHGPVIVWWEDCTLGPIEEPRTLSMLSIITISRTNNIASGNRNNEDVPGVTVWKERGQQVVDRLMHALPSNMIPPGGF